MNEWSGNGRLSGAGPEVVLSPSPTLPVLRSFRPDLRSGQDWPHVAADGFASGLGKVRSDEFEWGFIGTLAGRVQG